MEVDRTEVPNPPWHREPRRRSAKPQLSQELIVTTAMGILAAEGIDAVSMRRIAAEFDTGPSSLYAHVTNKDELLQLMFDEMCALVPIPEIKPGEWKEQVKGLARASHQVMIEHNDLARAALATIPSGPNALRVSEAMFTMLLDGGVPAKVAGWVLDRLFLYITADAYEYSIWGAQMRENATFITQLSEDLVAYFEQLPADTYPNLQKHGRAMVGGGPESRFEFGLDMLIDGLDHYVTTTPSE
jgi:AcrR family transcriptional regulator